MSILPKAISSRLAKTPDAQKIIYVYVIILVVMILSQLFTYEDFTLLIESFWLPGGQVTASLISCLIITFELFALPFLLRLKLSPLMRYTSMVLSWLAPAIWLFLTLWVNLTFNSISNIGFLGTVFKLTPGWWAVFVSIAIGIMAAWSSWGLWPIVKTKLKSK